MEMELEGGRGDPLKQEEGVGEEDFPIAVATPLLKKEGERLQLPVHFQEPSTSQSPYLKSQKSRLKGRKSEKPVKLSKRRGNNSMGDNEGMEALFRDELHAHLESNLVHEEEEGNAVIKHMKWDISRDFSKERKQAALGGVEPKEEDLSQPSFPSISAHQAFDQDTDYISNICSSDQSPPPLNITQEELLQNGLVATTSKDKDIFEDLVVDDSLKYRRIVGSKIIYHCPVCEAVFTDLFQFNLHREEAHPEQDAMKRFECQACKKTFLGRRVLNQHYKRNHPDENFYTCPVCDQTFPTVSSLCLHKRNHVGHRPFKCEDDGCDRAFPDVASLNRHKRTHCKERPHVCQHCGKAFKMQNHLREHTRLHTGEKPFVCEVCGVGFAQSNGLKSHARQHMLDRKNQCNICHKIFSHPQFLELHKKNHSEEKPYTCEVCGQAFRTTTNLGAHKRLKHDMVNRKGTNVFTCDVCGSTFAQACNLAVHKKIHGGEKPYACNLCDQTFRTPANLGAHRKLKHEMDNTRDEKHFTCDICGASFSQACNLGIHKKKKHTDAPPSLERNYVCDICDARFSEPCNLGAHKKIKHAEQSDDGRPVFECDICAAKFYRACNLSGHRRRKHGDSGDMKQADKPYMCQFCSLRCSSLENLHEHKAKIHFSMPTGFPDKKNASRTMAMSQQQTTLPSTPSAFEAHSQQQQSVPESSSLDLQQHKIPQGFPKSIAFPGVVPASSDTKELSHHDSFIDQSEPAAATSNNKYANSSSRAFITPGCYDFQHKLPFNQSASAFDSRLTNMANPSLPSFPLDMRPLSCHVCRAQMPDERTLLQHLEMHTNEKYLHDVFSSQ